MSAQPAFAGSDPVSGNGALRGSRELATGKGIFPAVPESSPAAPRYETISLSPEAELYSFTIIHPNPKTGERPFVLVYADFPEDVRAFGKLDLPEGVAPRIGMRLRALAEEAGGCRFSLADGAAR